MERQFRGLWPNEIHHDRYYWSNPIDKSLGWNILMRKVIEYKKYGDILLKYIKNIINENPKIVNERNSNDENALMIACMNGELTDIKIIKLLLEKGSDMYRIKNNEYCYDAMRAAVDWLQIEFIQALIDHGYDINIKINGLSILHYVCTHASHSSKLDLLQLLVKNGADINIQSNYGKTALALLCQYDKTIKEARILIDAGCNLYIKDIYGRLAHEFAKYKLCLYVDSIIKKNEAYTKSLIHACSHFIKHKKNTVMKYLLSYYLNKDIINKLSKNGAI